MARPSVAPRRYAEAAFELARRDGTEDAWATDLELADELIGDQRVLRVTSNPAVPLAERDALVHELLDSRANRLVVNLVLTLVRRGRVESLPEVRREYARLLRQSRGIVAAHVVSAVPLSEAEAADVREAVGRLAGAEAELQTSVDPALIGGLTVQIGDRLYDASVRGRLERLRTQLVTGAR
jgi:F-type H+-transporting ATPase subunit delta